MNKDDIKCLGMKFVEIIEEQMDGDLSRVCTSELGEVVDMAKDCGELLKYISEAEYYTHVVDAMEESTTEEVLNKEMKYARSRMYFNANTIEEIIENIKDMVSDSDEDEKQNIRTKLVAYINAM